MGGGMKRGMDITYQDDGINQLTSQYTFQLVSIARIVPCLLQHNIIVLLDGEGGINHRDIVSGRHVTQRRSGGGERRLRPNLRHLMVEEVNACED